MTTQPVNTGINANGDPFFIWAPFNETGEDNNHAVGFGSIIGFGYNGNKQKVSLDEENPENSRPLPTQILIGGAAISEVNPLPIAGSFSASVSTEGVYNSVLPVLTNGDTAPLQFDSSGRLIITGPISGTVTANLGNIAGVATEVTLSTLNAKFPTLAASSNRLLVDGSGVTQPISGTLTGIANTVPVSIPRVASATNATQQTNATGTNYNTLTNASCTALEIVNNTGTIIEYQRGGSGAAIPIQDKTTRLIVGITNANQIGIRRADASDTQVTVAYEYYT